MDTIEHNRRDAREDDLAPLPIDTEPGGAGLRMLVAGYMGFLTGAAVVVIAIVVINIQNLAGEVVSVGAGALMGAVAGLLLGVVAGWLVSTRYALARDPRLEPMLFRSGAEQAEAFGDTGRSSEPALHT